MAIVWYTMNKLFKDFPFFKLWNVADIILWMLLSRRLVFCLWRLAVAYCLATSQCGWLVLNSCEPIIFDICAWFGQLWDETKFAFSHLLLSEYNKLNTCDPDKTQRRCWELSRVFQHANLCVVELNRLLIGLCLNLILAWSSSEQRSILSPSY
jgi:hypothetical protein